MKHKTISGHYDTAYSIAHNNREFLPSNADYSRIPWNYNCIAVGGIAEIDPGQPRDLHAYWERYRAMEKIYWSDRSLYQAMLKEKYQEQKEYMRRYYRAWYDIQNDPMELLIVLLFLPIMLPLDLYLYHQYAEIREELEALQAEQDVRDLLFKSTQTSLRQALRSHDLATGSKYLHVLDSVMRDMAQRAQDYEHSAVSLVPKQHIVTRYATLEEIYDKVYEPAFQVFQAKQRPCRRYHGTYLEQIRENQAREHKKKQQTKNARSRTTAEAIEIVFGIGDMDNTGYLAAYEDARKAEALLRDYCNYLLKQPNVCTVTTLELEDPNWQPPFRNGLIILNLTVHADEATPGIHLTCIPYSRGCTRGPSVQAALGRAMTGMGYPSTWKDVLDEKGEKIPKRSKDGQILYNKNGTIRYRQEPDKQGIIDWIEDQKRWIQQEMGRRYGWDREYKGSHPRGNLSTPDYQVARARERLEETQHLQRKTQERKEEYEQLLANAMEQYQNRINHLSAQLNDQVYDILEARESSEIIRRYLALCPDEEYGALAEHAYDWLDQLAPKEQQAVYDTLIQQIQQAKAKYASEAPKASAKEIGR